MGVPPGPGRQLLGTLAACAGALALGFGVVWLQTEHAPYGFIAAACGALAVVTAGLGIPLQPQAGDAAARSDPALERRKRSGPGNAAVIFVIALVFGAVVFFVRKPETLFIVLMATLLWQFWVGVIAVAGMLVLLVVASASSGDDHRR